MTGGNDVLYVIDGACAVTGVVALFRKVSPVGVAFCAGWALGRWIDTYINK